MKKEAEVYIFDRNLFRVAMEDFHIWQQIFPSGKKVLLAIK
jgi:hypothetical protein